MKMAVSTENSHGSSLNLNKCDIEILVGTYEEFVLGYKLTNNPEGVSFTAIYVLKSIFKCQTLSI